MPRQPNRKTGDRTDNATVNGRQEAASATPDKGETGSKITAADVAGAMKATVRVLEKNNSGALEAIERDVAADDILSFRVDGSRVIAVTIDGRKHSTEIDRGDVS